MAAAGAGARGGGGSPGPSPSRASRRRGRGAKEGDALELTAEDLEALAEFDRTYQSDLGGGVLLKRIHPLVAHSEGDVPWTVIDLTPQRKEAYCPENVVEAILQVELYGDRVVPEEAPISYADPRPVVVYEFRLPDTPGANIVRQEMHGHSFAATGCRQEVLVPLKNSRFEYRKVDQLKYQSMSNISVVGFICKYSGSV